MGYGKASPILRQYDLVLPLRPQYAFRVPSVPLLVRATPTYPSTGLHGRTASIDASSIVHSIVQQPLPAGQGWNGAELTGRD